MRGADTCEQRHVEDAVAARVAVSQIDLVLFGPGAHRTQLARPPDEAVIEAARVAAVLDLVVRGDQIVETDGLGERADHVGRGGRREHQPVALRPEGSEALRCERGDDLAQPGDRPAAGGLNLLLAPAPGHPGGRPDQAHGEEVLPQPVVDRIEELVARERASLGQHSLLHEGVIEDLAGGPAEQRAVEIDEDGAFRHG